MLYLGPVQVGKLFPLMLAATSLPLIINPNAGLPGTAWQDLL